jgi:hypothetical protein
VEGFSRDSYAPDRLLLNNTRHHTPIALPPQRRRGRDIDVLRSILTVETNLMQSPPRTGLRGTLEQCFELGGRQGDQPVWFLVHGAIRQRLVHDQARP